MKKQKEDELPLEVLPEPESAPHPHLHEVGIECGEHIACAITEASHVTRFEKLGENGHTKTQVIIACLKALLDNDYWHTAGQFLEEAVFDEQSIQGHTAMRECRHCQRLFIATRPGQPYCCNACGHRADGATPTVDHEDNCYTQTEAGWNH